MIGVLAAAILAAGAAAPAVGGSGEFRSSSLVAADPGPKERRATMDPVVAQATMSSGREYVALEERLRAGGQEALVALRRRLADPDPVNQLMASVLIGWIEGRAAECQAALEFLDSLERRLAKTPVGNPPPVGVAAELDDRFGPRVAECLALRLVKENDWPHWRVMGTVLYLRDQKVPATTSALVRFAALTPNPAWQKGAVEAIAAIQDPDLPRKLDIERQRLASTGKTLPEPLQNIPR